MEDQRPTQHFQRNEDSEPGVNGRALWQSVRRPRRGRTLVSPVIAAGPYETSYPITTGYPDREVVVR